MSCGHGGHLNSTTRNTEAGHPRNKPNRQISHSGELWVNSETLPQLIGQRAIEKGSKGKLGVSHPLTSTHIHELCTLAHRCKASTSRCIHMCAHLHTTSIHAFANILIHTHIQVRKNKGREFCYL